MDRLKLLAMMALVYMPRRLPVGMTEFNTWSDRIIKLSGQFADADSMKWTLATIALHLGPQASSKADIYFIRSMRKAAVNQVVSQAMQDIKAAQAQKLAQQQAEATATPTAASDDQTSQKA